jgi:hypothetical protein
VYGVHVPCRRFVSRAEHTLSISVSDEVALSDEHKRFANS